MFWFLRTTAKANPSPSLVTVDAPLVDFDGYPASYGVAKRPVGAQKKQGASCESGNGQTRKCPEKNVTFAGFGISEVTGSAAVEQSGDFVGFGESRHQQPGDLLLQASVDDLVSNLRDLKLGGTFASAPVVQAGGVHLSGTYPSAAVVERRGDSFTTASLCPSEETTGQLCPVGVGTGQVHDVVVASGQVQVDGVAEVEQQLCTDDVASEQVYMNDVASAWVPQGDDDGVVGAAQVQGVGVPVYESREHALLGHLDVDSSMSSGEPRVTPPPSGYDDSEADALGVDIGVQAGVYVPDENVQGYGIGGTRWLPPPPPVLLDTPRGAPTGVPVAEAVHAGQPSLVPREVKLAKPSLFHGNKQTVDNFIFEMKQYVECVGLGAGAAACKFVVSHFKDDALAWWRDYSRDSVSVFEALELDVLLQALREYFCDADEEMKLRDRVLSLKQTGSVAQFAMALKHFQLKLGQNRLPDNIALHVFTVGLRPFTRQQVLLQRPESLEDAILLAERAEQSMFLLRGDRRGSSFYGGYGNNRQGGNSKGGYRSSANSHYKSSGPVPMELGSAEVKQCFKGDAKRSKVVCHHCGKTGHMKKDCYRWQREQGGKQQQGGAKQYPGPPKN